MGQLMRCGVSRGPTQPPGLEISANAVVADPRRSLTRARGARQLHAAIANLGGTSPAAFLGRSAPRRPGTGGATGEA